MGIEKEVLRQQEDIKNRTKNWTLFFLQHYQNIFLLIFLNTGNSIKLF